MKSSAVPWANKPANKTVTGVSPISPEHNHMIPNNPLTLHQCEGIPHVKGFFPESVAFSVALCYNFNNGGFAGIFAERMLKMKMMRKLAMLCAGCLIITGITAAYPKKMTIFADEECDDFTITYDAETGSTILSGHLTREKLEDSYHQLRNGRIIVSEDAVFPQDCSFLFCGISATSIDLSRADTSNAVNMDHMFGACTIEEKLVLSGIDTSNVTNMEGMFHQCTLTTMDLSGLNTSNVTDMKSMFMDCQNLTSLDLSGFNTSNVTNMSQMFNHCTSLTSLDLSGFNTSNVTNMNYMFRGCTNLTVLDLSGFNTSNVTYMRQMFEGVNLTTLDISSFDTSKVTNMDSIFSGCVSLHTIFVSEKWSLDSLSFPQSYSFFNDCRELVGGHGTHAWRVTDHTYDRIDKAGEPGVLTLKDEKFEKGDMNLDGTVSIDDVQLALIYYTKMIAGYTFYDDMPGATQIKAADINGDGELTIEDVQYILIYYTENTVAQKQLPWADIMNR